MLVKSDFIISILTQHVSVMKHSVFKSYLIYDLSLNWWRFVWLQTIHLSGSQSTQAGTLHETARIWYSSERFGQVSLVVSYENSSRLNDYDEILISQVCPILAL